MTNDETVVRGWFTTKQAAEFLGVSTRHFWRIADERNLGRQMLNPRSSLWNASDIKRLAKQRSANSGC